jgi:CRISPR type III-A-associated protein Csm2
MADYPPRPMPRAPAPPGGGSNNRFRKDHPDPTDWNKNRGDLTELLRKPTETVRYFAENSRAVRPELLAGIAEETARKLADVPSSQLRRFYAEVMALKRRIELANTDEGEIQAKLHEEEEKEIQAKLHILRAKAVYIWGRSKKYPGELVAFFNRHANAVRTRDDFLRGFQPHFEAVMAFHKFYAKEEGAA